MKRPPPASAPPSAELFEALQSTMRAFEERAEKLDAAYRNMQVEFSKINIELEHKNRELAHALEVQQETRNYLNSILESMNNGVVGVDLSGTITQFNRAAARITGHDPSEVCGRLYSEMFVDATRPELSLVRVLHSGAVLEHDEKVLWHKEGTPVPVSFQTAILRDAEGNKLGAVEIFSDISRIKALEEEMQQTRTMAALGEMSATVAHEIRNPLGAMGVWAGLLERDLAPGDPRKKTLAKITEGLGRLNRIVSNLLVYARPARAQLRRVDLRHILDETVDFVEIEIERQGFSIQVAKCWRAEEPACAMVDPEKMQQIVMNLCLNAIQSMPGGGVLRVDAGSCSRNQSRLAYFSVHDTGTGIEPGRLERIFDPFHTSRENGTGLGLAIVKKFVEIHSGFIDVKSVPGSGSEFKVFLPGAGGSGEQV